MESELVKEKTIKEQIIEGDYNTLFDISPSKIHDKLKELGYEMQDFDLN